MATTKIWAVKDNISRVLSYASNPKKTSLKDLEQVLKYAENTDKTKDDREKVVLVTGVNCNRETAYQEMLSIKKRFNKTTGGNSAYHAYQSFKTGEVSAQKAHQIGIELASEMWPEHQVLVATHLNTGTYHNHFVVNSVNMFTGEKFNCNKGAYYKFRGISDKICEKNGLTVIKNPKGRTPRNIYFAEKRGEPTKYNLMREAIDEALDICITGKQFENVMRKKGYIIEGFGYRMHPTIRPIYGKKATRMYRLGEKYTFESIRDRLLSNPRYFNSDYESFMIKNSNRNIENHWNGSNIYRRGKYKGNFLDNLNGVNTLSAILITFLYILGAKPRITNFKHIEYKPKEIISPEVRAEVRKLHRYSKEVILVVEEKLETNDDVEQFIKTMEQDVESTKSAREKYRNKLRNCSDEVKVAELKAKRDACTQIIAELRAKIKTANWILEDIPMIKKKIKIEKQMRRLNYEEETEGKNRNKQKSRDAR